MSVTHFAGFGLLKAIALLLALPVIFPNIQVAGPTQGSRCAVERDARKQVAESNSRTHRRASGGGGHVMRRCMRA